MYEVKPQLEKLGEQIEESESVTNLLSLTLHKIYADEIFSSDEIRPEITALRDSTLRSWLIAQSFQGYGRDELESRISTQFASLDPDVRSSLIQESQQILSEDSRESVERLQKDYLILAEFMAENADKYNDEMRLRSGIDPLDKKIENYSILRYSHYLKAIAIELGIGLSAIQVDLSTWISGYHNILVPIAASVSYLGVQVIKNVSKYNSLQSQKEAVRQEFSIEKRNRNGQKKYEQINHNLRFTKTVTERISHSPLVDGLTGDLLETLVESESYDQWQPYLNKFRGFVSDDFKSREKSLYDQFKEQNPLNQENSSEELNRVPDELVELLHRSSKLFEMSFMDDEFRNQVLEIELALMTASSQKKSRWGFQPNIFQKATRVLLENDKGKDTKRIIKLLEQYVLTKERYLSSNDQDSDVLLEDIQKNILSIKKVRNHKGISRRDFLKAGIVLGGAGAIGLKIHEGVDLNRIYSATKSRSELEDVDLSAGQMLESFFEFIDNFNHPYLEPFSIDEKKFRCMDLLNQANLYWDGKTPLNQHYQKFFTLLCDEGEKSGVSTRTLFYYFRIGSQNIGSREGQNEDVNTGNLQLLLANALDIANITKTDDILDPIIDMAILNRSSIYDSVRTTQEVTLGIHDQELSLIAQAEVNQGENVPRIRAQELVDAKHRVVQKKKEIQRIVFDDFFKSLDYDQFKDTVLDPDFLTSIGIRDSVGPGQLTNYTRNWVIGFGLGHYPTPELLKETAKKWKDEYYELFSNDPKEASRLLILDQGKLKNFWIQLSKNPQFSSDPVKQHTIEQILDLFDSLDEQVSNFVEAKDNYYIDVAPKEYDMEFQIKNGTEVVKYFSDMVDKFMSNNPDVFGHLESDAEQRQLFQTYFVLNLREIANNELLVRAENQFPQERLSAEPYNYEMTLNAHLELMRIMYKITRNTIFYWSTYRDFIDSIKRGEENNTSLGRHYYHLIDGNSHHRAEESIKMMREIGALDKFYPPTNVTGVYY